MERLSGAPSDVINPNGLAFLVCTVLPFLYYLAGASRTLLTAALLLAPPCLYALALTGSRSGIIGLLVVVLGIVMKSKSRASFVAGSVLGLIAAGVGFAFLSPDLQDRYLSIVGLGEKNAGTLEDRLEGMTAQFSVMLNAPIVGHGLGTSAEANGNFTTSGPYVGWAMPAHNLYLEIGQELGVFGIVIYLVYIKSIFSGFAKSRRVSWQHDVGSFLPRLIDAMQVWLIMNLVFSFASYGLSSYEWYLFGGLSVVLQRLAESGAKAEQDKAPAGARRQEWIGAASGRGRWSS
jgi:O-antigen ligase